MNDVAISADGVPIYYETHGAGLPALVFVHGWSCDRSYWKQQIGRFARQYQVAAIDLAGHGESGLDRQAGLCQRLGSWPAQKPPRASKVNFYVMLSK